MPIARSDQPSEIVTQDAAAGSIDSVIQSVAGNSIAAIDRLIAELTGVREKLRDKGDQAA